MHAHDLATCLQRKVTSKKREALTPPPRSRAVNLQDLFREAVLLPLLVLLWASGPSFATTPQQSLVWRAFETPQPFAVPYAVTQEWRGAQILRKPSAAPYIDTLWMYDPEKGSMTPFLSIPRAALGPWVDPADDQLLLFGAGKTLLSVNPQTRTIERMRVAVPLTRNTRIIAGRIYRIIPNSELQILDEHTGAVEATMSLSEGYGYHFRSDGALIGESMHDIVILEPGRASFLRFPYNPNLICNHDGFQEFAQLLVIQANCGTLTVFDRRSGRIVAALSPPIADIPEMQFVISGGLLFTLPAGAQLDDPPLGRVYDVATGREIRSYLASGKLLGVSKDRIVTSKFVYGLDRTQLSNGALMAGLLRALPDAEALAAKDLTPYRAIEALDDAGMDTLAQDIIHGTENIDPPMVSLADQYSRWLAGTISRYGEAKELIQHLHRGEDGRQWAPFLADLNQRNTVLEDEPWAASGSQEVHPSASASRAVPGGLVVLPLPGDRIHLWTGPLPMAWGLYLEGMRNGTVDAKRFILPDIAQDDPCTFDVYDAVSLDFQKRVTSSHCEDLAGPYVSAVAVDRGHLYVLVGANNPEDEFDDAGSSAKPRKPNLLIYDSTTFREIGRYSFDEGASRLYASGNALLSCECPGGGNEACVVANLTTAGAPAINEEITISSDLAPLSCYVGPPPQPDAARALIALATGAPLGRAPEASNDVYVAVEARRPGASGFDAVDFLGVSAPHALVSQSLPADSYSFRQFIGGHENLALVARSDPQDIVFATFDIGKETLHPILDVPRASQHSQVAIAGDWLAFAVGRELLLRNLISPSDVYVAHFNGGKDSWLKLYPNRHWIVVRVMDPLLGPAPVVIRLDGLGGSDPSGVRATTLAVTPEQ